MTTKALTNNQDIDDKEIIMSRNKIYLGNNQASFDEEAITGELINFEGEVYFKISNSDRMRPFFMSLISNSNHWMFISSNGGLSAGRKDANHALFPYYTDDKITESAETTGSKTILGVIKSNKTYLWEPFSNRYYGIYDIQRNIYKNQYGNKVIFEEINNDLELTFSYQWSTSNAYGFIKKSKLINHSNSIVTVNVLDGLQNIIPFGVGSDLQNSYSNLVDAYKRSELQEQTGIGIYALSAIIVDKAEPSEALKSNTVWSLGFESPKYLLSSMQLDKFRRGEPVQTETDVKAEKGAYFISTDFNLESGQKQDWMFVANVNQSISDVVSISEKIKYETNLKAQVLDNVHLGTKHLLELAGASDAMQLSRNKLRNARHFSNTLFNIMRGGIFDNNYQIEKTDFIPYLQKANKQVYKEKVHALNSLPETFSLEYLKGLANADNNSDFKRLCYEYLPLKFSRRHGDPSRPWNQFSINTRSEVDGSKILDYEGNWRDIFQNWEALAHSYPEFIEGMIHKFLNATTFDGYNPYRVTKDGFDWETIEPDDPWSYIGYWGDHQIIYLLKFLEIIESHYPHKLATYFNENMFVYANVPYKIKAYSDLLKNPKDTIVFDDALDAKIHQLRDEFGADGALLRDKTKGICKANLMEKLLATVLAKLSNFIPEGGIWMNTQRPEWNDANNALVGNGVSMVTLYYLRRFISFFENIVSNTETESFEVSEELKVFFDRILNTFNDFKNHLNTSFSNSDRKLVLDGLGQAGSDFRLKIYDNGFSGNKGNITKASISQFLDLSNAYLEHSINANQREDKLYHAYNLMTVKGDSEIAISYLPEMLEGQVAVLSSGYISGEQSLEVLNALKSSTLFRPDQYSYLLYPNKELLGFFEKNKLPKQAVEQSELLQQLLKDGNKQIIQQDVLNSYHFNGNFNNADKLKEALDALPQKYEALVKKDRTLLLNTYEELFNHKAFTGRSGTFFGYEGLGSIYWHMVSKLLLAVQETSLKAYKDGESEVTIGGLLDHYYEINEGIGVHKSPKLYGAFPTDPYSHTPLGKGAQQPGMTGQVKEDILCRFGELGVFVENGKIVFNPKLLRGNEFLKETKTFVYTALNNEIKKLPVDEKSICFTYCQVPIIYKLSSQSSIEVVKNNGKSEVFDSLIMDTKSSESVFKRKGEINYILVSLKE